jgi:hypothetical protein
MIIKKFSPAVLLILLFWGCQSIGNSSKGKFQKRLQRVAPNDIMTHTRKILVNKYHYQLAESQETASSIYLETMWKEIELVEQEKERNLQNVRVRFKVRSRETRSGPEDTYNVHSLRLEGEVEAYKSTGGEFNWIQATITPQRMDYLQDIYRDYKLEFDSGLINYN